MKYYINTASGELGISLDGLLLNNGSEISKETFTLLSDSKFKNITEALCSAIDAEAGNTRLPLLTTIAGQSDLYLLKYLEAYEIAECGYNVDISEYPLIETETLINGSTVEEAAKNILSITAQRKKDLAKIETIRLGGKKAVRATQEISTKISILVSTLMQLSSIQNGSSNSSL